MFKSLALATALSVAATTAFSDGYSNNYGVIVDIQPHYQVVRVPVTQERCTEVQVPVYSNNNVVQGNALAGALIGGAIGNQFGSGSGNDAMTILGAIIGANQAARPRAGIVGYTTQVECGLVTVNTETRELINYQVTYRHGNRYYIINTTRFYEIGQRIEIN